MKIKTYEVYRFDELRKEAKQKAIDLWYETEDYPMLKDDLIELLKDELIKHKIGVEDGPEVYYQLQHCQGDGACFTGVFTLADYVIHIEHNGRYFHRRSTDIVIYDKNDDTVNEDVVIAFRSLYYSICDTIERVGYTILDYRMDFKEFNDHCESNDYWFTGDGKID